MVICTEYRGKRYSMGTPPPRRIQNLVRGPEFSGLGERLPDAPHQLLTVKIRQPSHEFTFGVGMSFIPYPLVLTLVV
jgi:hypothetical protein